MSQEIFKFPSMHDYAAENFLVSSSNEEAYLYITNFPWDFYAVNIYGGKSCGKTHLANIANSNVKIFENIDESYKQEELLHQLNTAKENGEFALLTSNKPLSEIDFSLADLTSRLKAIPAIEIATPDEQLAYMLFARQFAAKQLTISDEVLNFLVVRTERNFAAIFDTVEKIDNLSLQEKRNVTIPLIKQIL